MLDLRPWLSEVMWVQELGFLDTAAQASIPENDIYPVKITSIDSVYGKITFPASCLQQIGFTTRIDP
jgi:hypothetical protein